MQSRDAILSSVRRPPVPALWERPAVLASAITFLALVLRLFRINEQSVWIDEAFTIHAAASKWSEMLRILINDFSHPPLHTMLVRWWFDLLGVGTFQARVLSALFGTIAVAALYRLGSRLFDRRTALLASVLLAVSQIAIIFSQEARAYSMLILLYIVAVDAFTAAYHSGKVRDFVCFVVVSILMIYTHYYAIAGLAALLAFAFVRRRTSAIPKFWWLWGLATCAVAYLPWVVSGVIDSALRNPRAAVNDLVFAQLWSPLYALNWFNNGKVAGVRDTAPWWALLIGCALFTVPALASIWRTRRTHMDSSPHSEEKSDACLLLVMSCVLPVIAICSLGILHIIYDVRHVAFAVAPYYLLVARGIVLTRMPFRGFLVGGILAYSALSLRADYFIPYKDDYRPPLRILATTSREGDCFFSGGATGEGPVPLYWDAYYHGQNLPFVIRPTDSVATQCQRLWLIRDKAWWANDAASYAAFHEKLAKSHYVSTRWSFSSMDMQLYVRRD